MTVISWFFLVLSESAILRSEILTVERSPLRYVDNEVPLDSPNNNHKCDRTVAIYIDEPNPKGFLNTSLTICPGILFDVEHVLAAFNPFRQMVKDSSLLKKTFVALVSQRQYSATRVTGYEFITRNILCGEQVPPMAESEILEEQWFGRKRIHCPVHDLIVFKIDEVPECKTCNSSFKEYAAEFGGNNYENENALRPTNNTGNSTEKMNTKEVGPLVSKLAGPFDYLAPEFSFVSTGLDDEHTWEATRLREVKYTRLDRSLVDCEQWIPREWGHFICIKNKDKVEGIGTGAVLYDSNYTVFGIGSFMLEKQSESILVFTDVRRYRHIIFQMCV